MSNKWKPISVNASFEKRG